MIVWNDIILPNVWLTHELEGLALGAGGDELAEIGGTGVVVTDVGLGLLSVGGVLGGYVHGDMQIGTGVGGGLALTQLGYGGQLFLYLLLELGFLLVFV